MGESMNQSKRGQIWKDYSKSNELVADYVYVDDKDIVYTSGGGDGHMDGVVVLMRQGIVREKTKGVNYIVV